MITTLLYPLIRFGSLPHLSTASPVGKAHQDSGLLNIRGHVVEPGSHLVDLRERQGPGTDGAEYDGLWPPEPLEFPFPANTSENVDKEAGPNDMPPNIDAQNEDGEVHAFKEISKSFIEKNCSANQQSQILAAWEEARILAHAQTTFEIGFDYDTPHRNWLGKDWDSESRKVCLDDISVANIDKSPVGFLGERISANETNVGSYCSVSLSILC